MTSTTRLVPVLMVAAGCVHPMPLLERDTLAQVARHYGDFFPSDGDPDRDHDAGLLRPRFGLPVVARAGDAFTVEILERGGPIDLSRVSAALVSSSSDDARAQQCLQLVMQLHQKTAPPSLALLPEGAPSAHPAVALPSALDGCVALDLEGSTREALPGTDTVRRRLLARPRLHAPTAGPWDLVIATGVDRVQRAPRAVWLRADDPATTPSLRVAQLSDLHIGKGDAALLEKHLVEVIADVNARRPDLVIVTGDVANRVAEGKLAERARQLLLTVEAPLLVILGNHDIGFGWTQIFGDTYRDGWSYFARAFHPFLYFASSLGGWEFLGFDSGPSTASPRVLVRGIAPETLARLRADLDAARTSGRRGVVLFSHAPSRARITDGSPESEGLFGRMRDGHDEFEQLLLDEAAHGLRVIHLAGHTHWSDTFDARRAAATAAPAFARWPTEKSSPCPTPLESKAVLVTTQSATHSTPIKDSGDGYGYALLDLGAEVPSLARIRFGLRPEDRACVRAP